MKILPYSIQNDQPVPAESPSYSDGTNTYTFRTKGPTEGINEPYVAAILRGAASALPCLTPIYANDTERKNLITEKNDELKAVNTKIVDLKNQSKQLTTKINIEKDSAKKKELTNKRRSIIDQIKNQEKRVKSINNTIYNLQQTSKPYKLFDERDSSNPVEIYSQHYTNGTVVYLKNKKNTTISLIQQEYIISELMEILDEQLRSIYFKGLTDANDPLTWKADDTASAVPVLESLMRINLFDLEYIGTNAGNKNANAIHDLNLRIRYGNEWNDTDGYPYRFFYRFQPNKQSWCLWVPKTMPDIFVEPNNTDYYYTPGETPGAFTLKNKPGVSTLPCYALDHFGIGTIQCVLARGETIRSGAGGGAMRSDRVTEADYKWCGNKQLGYALNLDMKSYIPQTKSLFKLPQVLDMLPTPAGYQKTMTPIKPSTNDDDSMNSEIVYFKKFKDPNPGKKNLPKSTFPLASERLVKSGIRNIGKFAKKKKGSWEFGGSAFGKTGEVLKHMNADRESAGAVMRDAFNDMKFFAGKTDLGSATQFANWVVQNDTKAEVYWTDESADAKLFSDHSTENLANLKKQIRTAQEWCHLYGHGDGGSEEIGNFISGSKHCNTEQLAIETGQRFNKYKGLTVKITGYLMPNDGFAKQAFTDYDIAYLKNFDPALIDLSNQATAAAAIKKYIDQYPKPDLAPYLRSAPKAKTGPVVSREAYAKLNPAQQSRVKKDVFDMFRNILTLYYPLGIFVRYKIYDEGKKIFDHSFSAQSESFDLNQFNILVHTVKRVIAVSKNAKDEFVEAVNMKLKTRLQGETNVNTKKEITTYKIR
jgi:hypothetical protein